MTDHVEPAEETAAGDLTEATPHPLAGKAFWLAIGSLGLILSGAALVAAPIVAGPEGLGWFGAAFACAGLALMLEAFALPGWGGATGLVIEAMALLLGGLAAAVHALLPDRAPDADRRRHAGWRGGRRGALRNRRDGRARLDAAFAGRGRLRRRRRRDPSLRAAARGHAAMFRRWRSAVVRRPQRDGARFRSAPRAGGLRTPHGFARRSGAHPHRAAAFIPDAHGAPGPPLLRGLRRLTTDRRRCACRPAPGARYPAARTACAESAPRRSRRNERRRHGLRRCSLDSGAGPAREEWPSRRLARRGPPARRSRCRRRHAGRGRSVRTAARRRIRAGGSAFGAAGAARVGRRDGTVFFRAVLQGAARVDQRPHALRRRGVGRGGARGGADLAPEGAFDRLRAVIGPEAEDAPRRGAGERVFRHRSGLSTLAAACGAAFCATVGGFARPASRSLGGVDEGGVSAFGLSRAGPCC
jgi:hypothetical protein